MMTNVTVVTIPAEVQAYLDDVNSRVRKIATALHEALTEIGCNSYVKTIYIGYDINGEMTAAAYAHADHVEVALAVADDHPDPRFEDATHLTWRTLPLCLKLSTITDVKNAKPLLKDACERVASQQHDVHRDNDYFVERKHGRLAHRDRR